MRSFQDNRNHLRFNLRCRQSRLIPRGLHLGSTVKEHRAGQILLKAQTQLLNERKRQVHFTIVAMKDTIHQTEVKLATLFPSFIFEVSSFVTKAQQAQQIQARNDRQKHSNLC